MTEMLQSPPQETHPEQYDGLAPATLSERLTYMKGYRPDGTVTDLEILMPHESETFMTELQNWLPEKLDSLHLEGPVHSEYEPVDYGEFVSHQFSQVWGQKPSPEEARQVGPVIEVAGPTLGERSPNSIYGLEPDFASNIDAEKADGPVDFLADAAALPFRDEAAGTLFISCLTGAARRFIPHDQELRPAAIKEASRVVKPGGRLIWHGGTSDDVQDILSLGFTPEYLEVSSSISEMPNGDYVHPDLLINGSYVKPLA